jgi:UDP-N-acetylmuramate dehydrogenase
MSVATLTTRGKLTPQAPLAPLVWFKSGGAAETLFEPADRDDLTAFLADLDPAVPVMALGLGSNMIVRDGGVPGVTIRLGKPTTPSCAAAAGRRASSSRRPRATPASPGSSSSAVSPVRSAASSA